MIKRRVPKLQAIRRRLLAKGYNSDEINEAEDRAADEKVQESQDAKEDNNDKS